MRHTIRAGEVREGDRLIVPDGEHVVPTGYPRHIGPSLSYARWVAPCVARHRDELVVVERPDPPITITVELTREEADVWLATWDERAAVNAYCRAAMKVNDAIKTNTKETT